MDSDDIAPLYRLLDQYNYLEENENIDIVSGDFQYLNDDGEVKITNFPEDNFSISYSFLFRCYISNSAAMMRLNKIRESGVRYRTEYYVCSDHGFWIDLIPDFKFANLKGKPYQLYRTNHMESITTSMNSSQKKLVIRDTFVRVILKTQVDSTI